jgi:hypothetical protein
MAIEAGRNSGLVAIFAEQVVILDATWPYQTWVGISAVEAKGHVDLLYCLCHVPRCPDRIM